MEYYKDWRKKLIDLLIDSFVNRESFSREKKEEIGFILTNYAPSTLFKYYPNVDCLEYNDIETVFSSTMWFQSPVSFNDPFDCDFLVDAKQIKRNLSSGLISSNKINRGSAGWIKWESTIDELLSSFQIQMDIMKQSISVACLSEKNDSILMWSHYANNHKGFCVEYNVLDMVSKIRLTPVPIIYTNKKPSIRNIDYENKNKFAKETLELSLKALLTKANQWNYEKEWRIIRDKNSCGTRWQSEKRGALLDVILPSSIIAGLRMDNKNMEKLKELCLSYAIPLYKMEKDHLRYSLSKRRIC